MAERCTVEGAVQSLIFQNAKPYKITKPQLSQVGALCIKKEGVPHFGTPSLI